MDSLQLKTFWALFYKEVVAFKSKYFQTVFDNLFWSLAVVTPALFFLPAMGLPEDFGIFLLVVLPFVWGIFDIVSNATTLIGDITGDKTIQYELIMPIKQWAIFLKIIFVNAYRSFSVSLFTLPVGMIYIYLCKGLIIPVTVSGIIHYYSFLVLANLFYGCFGLFLAGYMQTVADIRNVRMRLVFPLWFIAGFNNSWQLVHKIVPKFSYALLFNPFVYVMEGPRALLLGQEGFLNFWVCVIMIFIWSVVFGVIGIKRFQKRLDCL
jgi:hypothetical protein